MISYFVWVGGVQGFVRCYALSTTPPRERLITTVSSPSTMKTLLSTRYVEIPKGVEVEVESRVVTVTGPRGKLVQSFKHVNLDMQKTGKNSLRVDLWFGKRKQVPL